jgi:hypothetical protein
MIMHVTLNMFGSVHFWIVNLYYVIHVVSYIIVTAQPTNVHVLTCAVGLFDFVAYMCSFGFQNKE